MKVIPTSAIKAAIESGELPLERYLLFKNFGEENRRNYAKKKEISKWRIAVKRTKKANWE